MLTLNLLQGIRLVVLNQIGDDVMKISYAGQNFDLTVNGDFEKSLAPNLPLTLTFKQNGRHEYFGQLPTTIDDPQQLTSQVVAGGIYFFQDWQAFSLNYADRDIAPYQVSYLGRFPAALVSILRAQKQSLELTLKN